MMDGIKNIARLLLHGLLFAVCGVAFFYIIIGAICTLLGL